MLHRRTRNLVLAVAALAATFSFGGGIAHADRISDAGGADQVYMSSTSGAYGTTKCTSNCRPPDNNFDVRNIDGGISWPSEAELDEARDQVRWTGGNKAAKRQQEVAISKKLGRSACRSNGKPDYDKAGCPFWYNIPEQDSERWGYTVHPSYTGGQLGEGAIAAWNIRIWREGKSQPIFERRLCTDDGKPGTITNWESQWWNCGTKNRGFSDTNALGGMLHPFDAADRSTCAANYRNGKNGQDFTTFADITGKMKRFPAESITRNPKAPLWDNGKPGAGAPESLPACY
jgi:hypothetical protein